MDSNFKRQTFGAIFAMSGLRHRGEGNGWDVHGQPVAQAFGVKPPVCLQFVEDDV